MKSQHIPRIDLQRLNPDVGINTRVAAAIQSACQEAGFFTITEHGVPEQVLNACRDNALKFFRLPSKRKMEVRLTSPRSPYGFSAMAQEALARSRGNQTPPDLKESFSIGPPKPTARPIDPEEAAFISTPNRWPKQPKDFRDTFETYYQAMRHLAEYLMRLFAIGLELPDTYFTNHTQNPISALRANYYPPLSTNPLPNQLRAGAHSDYGTLTILMQTNCKESLEIQNRSGKWIPVAAKSPELIVNIGDLMARWTNNKWVSSLHRVVIPTDGIGRQSERLSLAYFHQPDWDADICCIPSCVTPGEEPIYPPITSGRYLMKKFHSTVA